MYDIVAGSKTVKSSYLLSKKNALELFPMLRGDKLCGAIVYYDGKQFHASFTPVRPTNKIFRIRSAR